MDQAKLLWIIFFILGFLHFLRNNKKPIYWVNYLAIAVLFISIMIIHIINFSQTVLYPPIMKANESFNFVALLISYFMGTIIFFFFCTAAFLFGNDLRKLITDRENFSGLLIPMFLLSGFLLYVIFCGYLDLDNFLNHTVTMSNF